MITLRLSGPPARMRPNGHTIDPHHRQRQALRAVALFEFFKGIFVLLMGLCALMLVHRDVWVIAESLLALLHINTDRRFAQVFLDYADNVTDAHLWAAARIAFAYAALRFTEGYGLWRGRPWAEWVAFISGTLLLPLEVRELMRGVTSRESGYRTVHAVCLALQLPPETERCRPEIAQEPRQTGRLESNGSGAFMMPAP